MSSRNGTHLQPVRDLLFVEQFTTGDVSEGGIHLPQQSKQKRNAGRVLKVGEGVQSVQPGDIVLFSSYAGQEIEIEDVTFVVLNEQDILAIERPSDPENQIERNLEAPDA
jgi:chaperonin GroES